MFVEHLLEFGIYLKSTENAKGLIPFSIAIYIYIVVFVHRFWRYMSKFEVLSAWHFSYTFLGSMLNSDVFFGVCLNLKRVFWEYMLKSEAPTNRHISYTKTVSFPSWDPINRHPEALCMLALAACKAGGFFFGRGCGVL